MLVSSAVEMCLEYHRLNSTESTQRNYSWLLTAFAQRYGNQELHAIGPDDIQNFLSEITEGKKRSTRKLRFNLMVAFFNFIRNTVEHDLHNPCDTPVLRKMFRAGKPAPWKILDKEAIDEMIFRSPDPGDRLLLELMARGGLRVGEVLKLRVEDVEGRKLILNGPKSGREAEVAFIPQKTAERLKIYIKMNELQPGERVFPYSYSGRTEDGLRTAASHTGAIAVNDTIFDGALRQAGGIRAKDLDEFLDFAKIFGYAHIPKNNRVAVITFSGGVGSIVADVFEESGLKLAEFSKDIVERIKPTLPHSTRISNPLDCFSAGIPVNVFDAYKVPLNVFFEAKDVDIILACFMVNSAWTIDAKRLLSDLEQLPSKPMAAWVIGDYRRVREYTGILEESGLPVFSSPERAVRALGALSRYHTISKSTVSFRQACMTVV